MTTTPLSQSLPLSRWPGACDCHVHVYDDAYPLAATATFTPPPAPASAYAELQASLGLSRVVVVQPTGYGFDNACTLAAVAQLGAGARGVAILPPDVPQGELQRLHGAGMRGVRYMMFQGGLLGWNSLEAVAARLEPLGWHINLQFDGREMPQREALLRGLPGRLVIDHLAKFLGPVRVDDEAFQSLCRVLDGGRAWIKLSAPYESSRSGPPNYDDVAELASELARRYPERCLWASNWPHPNVKPSPSNAALLDWALARMGDDDRHRRILVDNPAALYGF